MRETEDAFGPRGLVGCFAPSWLVFEVFFSFRVLKPRFLGLGFPRFVGIFRFFLDVLGLGFLWFA